MTALKSYALPTLAAVALVAVYSLVQYYDDNVALRAEVQAMKSRACPLMLDGRAIAFSDYQKIDKTLRGYSRLSCFYKPGVKS